MSIEDKDYIILGAPPPQYAPAYNTLFGEKNNQFLFKILRSENLSSVVIHLFIIYFKGKITLRN